MIRAVIKDNKGNIWFSSDGGVFCYNGRETIGYNEEQGLCSNQVYALHQDHEGRIWIGTARGLMTFFENAFVYYGKPQGLPETTVRAIYEDRNNRIWIGTISDGVYCYAAGKILHYTTNEGLSSNSTWAFMQDRGGLVWIGNPVQDVRLCTAETGGWRLIAVYSRLFFGQIQRLGRAGDPAARSVIRGAGDDGSERPEKRTPSTRL